MRAKKSGCTLPAVKNTFLGFEPAITTGPRGYAATIAEKLGIKMPEKIGPRAQKVVFDNTIITKISMPLPKWGPGNFFER